MMALPPPQHKSIRAGSLRLHYLDWGTPGQGPLVLLHDLGECARNWDFFAASMRQEGHVLALDLRGHGESAWTSREGYTLQGYASDVQALMDQARLEQVTLVGHGLGGLTAVVYACAHPERIKALVVVDAGPETPSVQRPAAPEEWDSVEAAMAWLRGWQPNAEDEVLRHQAVHLTRGLPGGRRALTRDPQVLSLAACPDLWKEWAKLRCPVLIVRGRQSQVLTHGVAVRMKEAIPRVRLAELEGVGHWVHLEAPGAFETTVRWFLESPPE